jgi:hypothetical protein
LVEIKTGDILVGYLPSKKIKVVRDWLDEYRTGVEENFYELNPSLRSQNRNEISSIRKKKGGK